MHLNYPQKSNGLYILSRDNIDDIATRVLTEYMPTVLKHPSPVDIKHLAEEEYGLLIKHEFITCDASVLHQTNQKQARLGICRCLYRRRAYGCYEEKP